MTSHGIAMKAARVAGANLLVLMWSASLSPDEGRFMDTHIVYALLLVGLVVGGAGKSLGLGAR